METLFVYGALSPNCPNAHVLTVIGGLWEAATITGKLRAEGYGAEMGYPGITITEDGDKIEGLFLVQIILE